MSKDSAAHPPATLKSWDEVWEYARQKEATHYNYCRGRQRFRGIFDQPEEIGTAAPITPNDTIRIRLYQETEEDFIDLSEHDCYLRLPSDYALSLGDSFGELSPAEQTQVVLSQMHRISAMRWQKQADAAEKILWQYIDFLNKTLEKKEALIAALQKRNEELLSSRGINSIYDFLVHPNAKEAIQSISDAISNSRTDDDRIHRAVEKALASLDPAKAGKR